MRYIGQESGGPETSGVLLPLFAQIHAIHIGRRRSLLFGISLLT
jgi:hypothetical protein